MKRRIGSTVAKMAVTVLLLANCKEQGGGQLNRIRQLASELLSPSARVDTLVPEVVVDFDASQVNPFVETRFGEGWTFETREKQTGDIDSTISLFRALRSTGPRSRSAMQWEIGGAIPEPDCTEEYGTIYDGVKQVLLTHVNYCSAVPFEDTAAVRKTVVSEAVDAAFNGVYPLTSNYDTVFFYYDSKNKFKSDRTRTKIEVERAGRPPTVSKQLISDFEVQRLRAISRAISTGDFALFDSLLADQYRIR